MYVTIKTRHSQIKKYFFKKEEELKNQGGVISFRKERAFSTSTNKVDALLTYAHLIKLQIKQHSLFSLQHFLTPLLTVSN